MLLVSIPWIGIVSVRFPVNHISYLLIFSYILLLLKINSRAIKTNNGLNFILLTASILTFLQQIIFLLYFEDYQHLVNFKYHPPNIQDVNYALAFLISSTIVLALSIDKHNDKNQNHSVKIKNKKVDLVLMDFNVWSFYILFSILLGIYLTFTFSVGVAGVKASGFAWLSKIFSETICIIFIVYYSYVSRANLSKTKRSILIVFSVLFIFMTIIQGSRGGIVALLTCLLIVAILKHGDFIIKKKKLALFITLLILTLFVIVPVSTAIRSYNISSNQIIGSINDLNFAPDFQDALFLIQWPSSRYGRFDQLIVICSEPLPNATQEIPLSNIIKSTYNSLTIGKSEELLKLGNGYPVIYNHFPRNRIHGVEWSLFGVSYFYFKFLGALLFILFFGILMKKLYSRLLKSDMKSYKFIYFLILFLISFYGLFTNGLLDSFISEIVINFSVIFGVEKVAGLFRKKYRLLKES